MPDGIGSLALYLILHDMRSYTTEATKKCHFCAILEGLLLEA